MTVRSSIEIAIPYQMINYESSAVPSGPQTEAETGAGQGISCVTCRVEMSARVLSALPHSDTTVTLWAWEKARKVVVGHKVEESNSDATKNCQEG